MRARLASSSLLAVWSAHARRMCGSESRRLLPRSSWLTALLCLLPLIACLACFPRSANAQDGVVRTVRLTSLEWPPYAGKALPQQGASVAVVRSALAAMGVRLEVEFVPWTRAVALGQDSKSGFSGYFPEYESPEVASMFTLSQPIGHGPLGLVERRSAAVAWRTLDDLKGLQIGVVRGYINTEDFDAMVVSRELTAVPASDDLANVRKVISGRLPLAVIDRNVLAYLMANDRSVADARRVLQFNARALENKSLHVALQDTAEGEWALQMINQGLKKIDAVAIAAPFFE